MSDYSPCFLRVKLRYGKWGDVCSIRDSPCLHWLLKPALLLLVFCLVFWKYSAPSLDLRTIASLLSSLSCPSGLANIRLFSPRPPDSWPPPKSSAKRPRMEPALVPRLRRTDRNERRVTERRCYIH